MNLNKFLLLTSLFSVVSSYPMDFQSAYPIGLGSEQNKRFNNLNLSYAAAEGRTGDVECYLDRGADINFMDAQGYSPLMYAAKNADTKTCKLLLDRGADLNRRNWKMTDAEGFSGHTALTYAAHLHHESICKLILNSESKKIKLPKIKMLLFCLRQLKNDCSRHPATKAGAGFLYREAGTLLRKHFAHMYFKPIELLKIADGGGGGRRPFYHLRVPWLNPEVPE